MLSQYGVRIHSNTFKEMKWSEFKALIAGLSADTALGRIVSVRAENDKDTLKHFTKEQLKIRSDWRNKSAKKVSDSDLMQALDVFKNAFIDMAGDGDKK